MILSVVEVAVWHGHLWPHSKEEMEKKWEF